MSFLTDLFGGGGNQAPASVQTLSQTSEFPSEVKPFITDTLEKAKAQQEGREFELFQGPRIAPFSGEEQAAFTGIQGIADAGLGSYPDLASSAFYAQQAQDAAEQGIQQFGTADVQRFTNPFQQQVIDIEKDEAIRQFEGTTLPQIGSQAAGAGSFGGSRQAILEAEAQRNLQQQLGDIQSRGLRDAYDRSASQFELEKARQAQGAGQFGGFATQFPGQAMRELGALQSVGEQKKGVDQRALDIALSDFLTEQEFPTRQLQEYQSLVRGFPISPNLFRQEVQSVPSVPLSQQLLGLGAAGAGIAGGLGAFRKSGGQISGGLSSLERHKDIRGRRATPVNSGSEIVLDLEPIGAAPNSEADRPRKKPQTLREKIEAMKLEIQEEAPGSGIPLNLLSDRKALEDLRTRPTPYKDEYTSGIKNYFSPESLEKDKADDKEAYMQQLYGALASTGLGVASTFNPGAGGLVGQVASAAKDAGAVDTITKASQDQRKNRKERDLKQLKGYEALSSIEGQELIDAFAFIGLSTDQVQADADIIEALREDPEKMKVVLGHINDLRTKEMGQYNRDIYVELTQEIVRNSAGKGLAQITNEIERAYEVAREVHKGGNVDKSTSSTSTSTPPREAKAVLAEEAQAQADRLRGQ